MKIAPVCLLNCNLLLGSSIASALLLLASGVRAEEPKRPTEPIVLKDSAVDLLQVSDAFDGVDPFDLNLSLSFEHASRRVQLYRELPAASEEALRVNRKGLKVARSAANTERLVPKLQIGLMVDLALTIKLPVILANNQRLDESSGGGATSPLATAGLGDTQLFALPFESPTRSGIEHLSLGLDFGLMNQFRTTTLLNWVIGIEGRFNVSEPMHACNDSPEGGQVRCAYPSDINRNGQVDNLGSSFGSLAGEPEGSSPAGGQKPGVSRGTNGLEVHTYVSQRIDSLEPYAGLSALLELPVGASAYDSKGFGGTFAERPPIRSTLTAGVAVIPWEQIEKFQRVSFDFRFKGTLVSRGRDYSELFDALGSSTATSIRNPHFSQYKSNVNDDGEVDINQPSVIDPESDKVYFTGLSEVSAHGIFDLSASFSWQAGSYVKFDLGGAANIIQGHQITGDQSCSANLSADISSAGPCKVNTETSSNTLEDWRATGSPNPNYRASINAPGQRYRVATSIGVSTWLNASVLF